MYRFIIALLYILKNTNKKVLHN